MESLLGVRPPIDPLAGIDSLVCDPTERAPRYAGDTVAQPRIDAAAHALAAVSRRPLAALAGGY